MRLEAIAIHRFAPFAAQKCLLGSGTVDGRRADTHIFVGENGTGKTRLLSLMLAAWGNNAELADRSQEQVHAVIAATAGTDSPALLWCPGGVHSGQIRKMDAALDEYVASGKSTGPNHGGHLSAHAKGTAAMAFRSVATVRDEKIAAMSAVDWGQPLEMLKFSPPPKSGVTLCQAIANMVIQVGIHTASDPDEGDPVVEPDKKGERVVRMVNQLHKTLGLISGRRFAFTVQQTGSEMRLMVVWGGVRMPLHHLPDGLRGIIGWLAMCVARLDLLLPNADTPLEEPIILFIDEPETHLHPAWQRQILPALTSLLPNAQIFVATHSPFVVSSVNSGWIYVLKADDKGVKINGPRPCSQGDTYIDAVEDALGLDKWYDPETEAMLAQFRSLRDNAVKSFNAADKEAMISLARDIAKRSESLQVMMGQELAQFEAKERLVGQKG